MMLWTPFVSLDHMAIHLRISKNELHFSLFTWILSDVKGMVPWKYLHLKRLGRTHIIRWRSLKQIKLSSGLLIDATHTFFPVSREQLAWQPFAGTNSSLWSSRRQFSDRQLRRGTTENTRVSMQYRTDGCFISLHQFSYQRNRWQRNGYSCSVPLYSYKRLHRLWRGIGSWRR